MEKEYCKPSIRLQSGDETIEITKDCVFDLIHVTADPPC